MRLLTAGSLVRAQQGEPKNGHSTQSVPCPFFLFSDGPTNTPAGTDASRLLTDFRGFRRRWRMQEASVSFRVDALLHRARARGAKKKALAKASAFFSDIRLQRVLLLRSDIWTTSKWYSLREMNGEYHITETEGFNITFCKAKNITYCLFRVTFRLNFDGRPCRNRRITAVN